MPLSIHHDGDIAVATIDYPPVNALNAALRRDLMEAVATLDADTSVRAVVLTCAGRTFIAGADISEFDRPPEEPHLPDVVAAIENASKPWTAAIHGTALGGGFEIALGCRIRVMAPTARLGLPEVSLGLVPGSGGTVRTPRLAGVEKAVELVTTGKLVGAEEALACGLIDHVAQTDLVSDAIAFARAALDLPLPPVLSAREIPSVPGADFWAQQEKSIAQRAPGENAPLRALACLRVAAQSSFEDAMAFERATFLELRTSEQAAALRHVFFAERSAPRPPEIEGVSPRKIGRTAVIGGGTMGAGIAAALREAGFPVTLLERDDEALARGVSNIRRIFDAARKRGRLSDAGFETLMSGIAGVTDYAALADSDLVIEAVYEDLHVKRDVFSALSAACRPDAILATNTSYLDPDLIAQGLAHPERFLGLHFFSPAHLMKLLEIVPIGATSEQTLSTGFAIARDLKKIPVRAGICDGFIGNRILKTTRKQAEKLLLSGATPAQVDAAMRGFGMRMGPFETQDLGGLDIAAFQRKAARERGEPTFAPVADRLVALGRLGQKTLGGWYDYAEGSRTPQPSQIVAQEIAAAATDAGSTARAFEADEILDVVLLPMVDEGARILQEGVATRASDIDLVEVLGYGFPRWRGGLMHWAQRRGLGEVVAQLARLAQQGLADAACDFLAAAARNGRF